MRSDFGQIVFANKQAFGFSEDCVMGKANQLEGEVVDCLRRYLQKLLDHKLNDSDTGSHSD